MSKKEFIIGGIILTIVTTAGYFIAPIEVRFLNLLTENSVLIGLTYAIGSILFGIFSIWIGRLSDKIGRERIIKFGCLFGILYPILFASAINIFQYMGVKIIWAFTGVSAGPIFYAYLQDKLKKLKNKGSLMGYVYSIGSITGAIAQFLSGFFSDHYGLSAPYYIMSGLFLMGSLLAFIFIGKNQKRNNYEKRDLFFSLKYIFSNKELKFYFIVNLAQSINWGIKGMIWPMIIFNFTGKDIITGSIFATMGVVAFICLPLTGKFVDKKGYKKGIYFSLSILGISGLILSFTNKFWIFWIFAGIYAIGESFWGPSQAVLLTDKVESKYRGEILGADAVFDRVYGTIAPFIAGILLVYIPIQIILGLFISLFWIVLGIGFFGKIKYMN